MSNNELKKDDLTPDTIKGIVDDLRKNFDEKMKSVEGQSAEFKRLAEVADTVEKHNTELVKKLEEEKSAQAEMKETIQKQMSLMEKMAARPAGTSEDDTAKQEAKKNVKHFEKFITKGAENMTSEMEVKFLNTFNDSDGGVLAPDEFVRDILKDIVETSNIRAISRVRTAGAGRMTIPVRSQLVTVNWEGEYEEAQDSNSEYALKKLPLNKLMVNVPITIEELQDAAFNMESEINADVALAFAKAEGAAFVSGNGTKKPEGFTQTGNGVAVTPSGATATFTMDNIILLAGELKTGYQPVYLMNRKTIAYCQTLKESTSGRYLWQAGNIAAGVPNQLNGYGYLEVPDMDDVGANALPVAFGDFREGYLIADGAELTVIRDPYTLKKRGMVEFTFMRRTGGMVTKPEAIKLLKCATS
jgi:HK97 family phage major capsid protein